ncbi:MAG: hypothetical protein ACR2OU_05200 [Thermomicrobiales bacterium]
MKLRRTIVAATAATVLLASTVMSGYALDTATSSITIGGGNFSAAISASNFANLPYSLTEQTARNGSLILTVNDQTGDAGGWSVTVDISDFIGQDRPAEVIPSENLVVTKSTITIAADGSQAVSEPNMTPVPGEFDPELTWTADPGYGQGAYNLTMTSDLIIPGRTTAQTYKSTGTLQIVTGP